jgi:hypothetical protein
MADRHSASKAQRFRPPCDLAEFEDTEHIRVMEMDVDSDAMPLGNPEHDIEMAPDVAVETCGIEPADEVGAIAYRIFEKFGSARSCHNAALWKGDDLDRHLVAVRLSYGSDGFEVSEAGIRVDIHVAAHVSRSARHTELDHARSALGYRSRSRERLLLERHSLANVEAGCTGPMRSPVIDNEALVEMDMSIDEARQHEAASEVDDGAR